jgi:hypothetical protein
MSWDRGDDVGRTDAMTRLRQLSSSPHEPERPRAHPVVTLAARLASRRVASSRHTPHLCHGADLDKTQYEYDLGPFLRDTLAPWMDFGIPIAVPHPGARGDPL